MKAARIRLRVKEKATNRTYIVYPHTDGRINIWWQTGRKQIIKYRAGYTEYNDRGEPVLDSWQEPINYILIQ